jgi:hypothetical protein
MALFKNPFVQGEYWHKGLLKTSAELFKHLGFNLDLEALVTDQSRTIFSHYFLAKPSFWKQYFKYAEQIFEIAQGHSSMARSLNEPVSYKNRQTKNIALKVFVMERLVTVLLEHLHMDAAIGFSHEKYAHAIKNQGLFNRLVFLDALKTTYVKTKNQYYLKMYEGFVRASLDHQKY